MEEQGSGVALSVSVEACLQTHDASPAGSDAPLGSIALNEDDDRGAEKERQDRLHAARCLLIAAIDG